MSDLAKRALACKGWRWLPGMVAGCGGRRVRSKRTGAPPYRGALPDLTDPATRGCLLALVREAWERPGAVCSCLPSDATGWLCCGQYGATEAEALVAALEAAP